MNVSVGVRVNVFVHGCTHVTKEILRSLGDIIRESGLDMSRLCHQQEALETGISTWMRSRHLKEVTLEVTTPDGRELIKRWDFPITFDEFFGGDGGFTADPGDIRYCIAKAGHVPSTCSYRFIVDVKPDHPDVEGWSSTAYLSTEGFHRHFIGTTIVGGPVRSGTAHWSRS